MYIHTWYMYYMYYTWVLNISGEGFLAKNKNDHLRECNMTNFDML